jgi:hypothetical protein
LCVVAPPVRDAVVVFAIMAQMRKRQVIVIVRERGGNPVPAVFHSESQAFAVIRSRIAKGDCGARR